MKSLPAIAAASLVLTSAACSNDKSTTAEQPSSSSPAPTQEVAGQFSVKDPDWIELIPNTTWNRCDGEPECDGEECFGAGPAEGLGFGAKVLVTNAEGTKVALDEIDETWGWEHPSRNWNPGNCAMYWSVDVPTSEAGVLTVTFDDNPAWAVDFTLKEMRQAPHSMDFISIG